MSQTNWEAKISENLRRQCSSSSARGDHCQVIIELFEGGQGEVYSLIDGHRGRVIRDIHLLSGVVAEVPFSAIEALARSGRVKKIWADVPIRSLK